MALAAEGGACCAQSGALRHLLPKHIAKGTVCYAHASGAREIKESISSPAKTALSFVLSFVYLSYILRICIVVDTQVCLCAQKAVPLHA